MSDWDFLYEMNDRGYSAEDIAGAAACGGLMAMEGAFAGTSVSDGLSAP